MKRLLRIIKAIVYINWLIDLSDSLECFIAIDGKPANHADEWKTVQANHRAVKRAIGARATPAALHDKYIEYVGPYS